MQCASSCLVRRLGPTLLALTLAGWGVPGIARCGLYEAGRVLAPGEFDLCLLAAGASYAPGDFPFHPEWGPNSIRVGLGRVEVGWSVMDWPFLGCVAARYQLANDPLDVVIRLGAGWIGQQDHDTIDELRFEFPRGFYTVRTPIYPWGIYGIQPTVVVGSERDGGLRWAAHSGVIYARGYGKEYGLDGTNLLYFRAGAGLPFRWRIGHCGESRVWVVRLMPELSVNLPLLVAGPQEPAGGYDNYLINDRMGPYAALGVRLGIGTGPNEFYSYDDW